MRQALGKMIPVKNPTHVQWLDRLGVLLFVVGGGLYIVAKLHFLTRYGKIGTSEYLEEHWPIWAAAAVIGLILLIIDWASGRNRTSNSN